MTARLDRASVERFRDDVERLVRRPLADDLLAVAVSGGPDSMAMLALAAAAFPGRVIAATIDHGLRADSTDEARMVADYAGSVAVPHTILTVATPPGVGDNLQAWARRERYRLLHGWAVAAGASALATAHHADDQAETFLMRATRGAGLSGLAGIRARHDPDGAAGTGAAVCALIRPVLGWRRVALRETAAAAGLPFVDDPSNADPRFDRVRMRDMLRDVPQLDAVGIARSAACLAEVEADLLAVTRWFRQERAVESKPDEVRIDIADVPRAVRRLLARDAIQHVARRHGESWDPADNIEALLDALERGKSATQAGVMASAAGTLWHFRKAPPRRSL